MPANRSARNVTHRPAGADRSHAPASRRVWINRRTIHDDAGVQSAHDASSVTAWVASMVRQQTRGSVRHFALRIGVTEHRLNQLLDPLSPMRPWPTLVASVQRAFKVSVPDDVFAAARRIKEAAPPLQTRPARRRRDALQVRGEQAEQRLKRKLDAAHADAQHRATVAFRPQAPDECWIMEIAPDRAVEPVGSLTLDPRELPLQMSGNYTLPDGHRVALLDAGRSARLNNIGRYLSDLTRRAASSPDGALRLTFSAREKTLRVEMTGQRVRGWRVN